MNYPPQCMLTYIKTDTKSVVYMYNGMVYGILKENRCSMFFGIWYMVWGNNHFKVARYENGPQNLTNDPNSIGAKYSLGVGGKIHHVSVLTSLLVKGLYFLF